MQQYDYSYFRNWLLTFLNTTDVSCGSFLLRKMRNLPNFTNCFFTQTQPSPVYLHSILHVFTHCGQNVRNLYERLLAGEEREPLRRNPEGLVTVHPGMASLFPSTWSPFLHFIVEVFSSWRCKAAWSDVPLGCNDCCMSGFPGMD